MYLTVAVIVCFIVAAIPSPGMGKILGAIGSAGVGLMWPVLPAFILYFTIKKFLFNRHGPSPKYFEFELLGCLVVGTAGLILWTFRKQLN